MKITKIDEKTIKFDDGFSGKTLEWEHEQDCCEDVYADFSALKAYNISPKTGEPLSIYDVDFEETILNLIVPVEDEGFSLVSKKGEKFFVPCHNEQNGYYSDDLFLILTDAYDGDSERIDVSSCCKKNYY